MCIFIYLFTSIYPPIGVYVKCFHVLPLFTEDLLIEEIVLLKIYKYLVLILLF